MKNNGSQDSSLGDNGSLEKLRNLYSSDCLVRIISLTVYTCIVMCSLLLMNYQGIIIFIYFCIGCFSLKLNFYLQYSQISQKQ